MKKENYRIRRSYEKYKSEVQEKNQKKVDKELVKIKAKYEAELLKKIRLTQ